MRHLYFFITLFFATFIAGAQVPDGYYDAATGTGVTLKSQLNDIISPHTAFPYSSSSTDVWDILKETDKDPNNSNNVILLYTGNSVNGPNEYDGGNGWNREHVWAQSHGDFGTAQGPGTDAHHLRPTNIIVNGDRGNLDFDNGGSQHSIATGCYYDSDSWESRDEVKGDVARMIFYMAVRYEGDATTDWGYDLEVVDYVNTGGTTEHGKLSTLIDWHQNDPVDDFETNRNEVAYDYQGNRNPFIDHPEWVNEIWGGGTIDPEPDNHAADFKRVRSATLEWGNSETPDNYLIKMNTTGCGDFTAPIDETTYSENDNLKIIDGTSISYEWSNLESGQTYYFIIVPFNGSGGTENYKTDGQIPCVEKALTN